VACNDSGGPGTPRPGHLYVADGLSVYIYATPLRSGDGPIDSLSFPRGIDPVFVAVDGAGNLAVSIDGGPIYWYSAPVTHASIPTDSVGSGGVGYTAFGPDHRLYVPCTGAGVLSYPTPLSHLSVPDTVKTGNAVNYAVTFDGSGALLVSGFDSGATVSHIADYGAPYASAPRFVIDSLPFMHGMVTTSRGDLLVATGTGNNVLDFLSPLSASSKAAFAITPGVANSSGLAIGPDGSIYVGNGNSSSVTAYAPPFSAASAPFASVLIVSGGNPTGIAVGP
jgi:hypothetical protein